ncbi:CoA transferase [Phenylobacterium sp.]|uniref:CaiB/BaiF CoA transferase family protein n=1 Tax=Phenylobacterium sp. TaxID=1871053 RepID=UPI00301BDD60
MAAPLEGLKVVDMGWIMVGPVSARYLAELGATTIKVETAKRPDPLRAMGPFRNGEPGLGRSMSYHMTNANKRSLAVDIKSADGLRIVRELLAEADVFVESFTPGAIDEMGLSYAEVSKRNPGLVMVSTGILGRKGPMGVGTSGTGMSGAAFAGATGLVGWPDRVPNGPHGPWTDAVAPRYIAVSVLAALHRRQATGKGVHIDLGQADAGLQFLTPAYMDYVVNGVTTERDGRAGSPLRAPCGAYPSQGEDRWVVVDAAQEAAWSALREIVGEPLSDDRFSTLVGRLRAREDLDARIAAWTARRTAEEAEATLQAAGVPAHAIHRDVDLSEDPDLEHVSFFKPVSDPLIGESWIPGPQFALRRTPHAETRAGPRIGDSTDQILEQHLGLSPDEIGRLKASGVLT